jgi:hypothetical protein
MKLKSSLLGKAKKMFLLVFGRAASSALECGGTTPLWVELHENLRSLNRATCRAEEKRRRAAALQNDPSPNYDLWQ